ncbi:hypothetical protein KUTeg_005962 [Tegillarca granosa]|uniref:Uncharacterized protein n=1 Tax=Tegillarca granosa TaxID=220873 RepID=A0ABQ9FF23_TEGGR|nr:hypothetical protein KUTeg_005962 [Tegillarca granosa]
MIIPSNSMASACLTLIVILFWNGICLKEIASGASGDGSGESSGEPLIIESSSGSGDSSGSTATPVTVPVSSGDEETGSGETATSGDNLIITSGDGVNSGDGSGYISNDTLTTISSGDGSGETSGDSFSGEGLLTTTVPPAVVDGSGSVDGSGDTTVAIGSGDVSGDGSGVTSAPDTGSGSGEEPSISGDGSGDTNVTIPGGMTCDTTTANSKPLEIFDITSPTKVLENGLFQIQFRIKDSTSGEALSDLQWSECVWSVSITVLDYSSYKLVRKGFLAVSLEVNINEDTATVLITGLSLSTNGMAVLQISMTTNPTAYQITTWKSIIVESVAQQQIIVTVTQVIEIKFEYDYNTFATEEFKSMVYNFVLSNSDGKVILGIELREGSIIAKVTIGASSKSSVTSLQNEICKDFNSNFTLQYNGQTITIKTIVIKGDNGDTSCHSESSDDNSNMLMIGLIVGIIFCALGIAIICAILFWRFKIYPNRKISSKEDLKDEFEEEFLEQYEAPVTEKQAEVLVKYLGTSHFIEEKLWRSSFSSLREKSILADNPLAPISTSIPKNSKGIQGLGGPKSKHRQRGSKKVPPVETTEPLPPLMINGRRVNIPSKFSPFKFSFKN